MTTENRVTKTTISLDTTQNDIVVGKDEVDLMIRLSKTLSEVKKENFITSEKNKKLVKVLDVYEEVDECHKLIKSLVKSIFEEIGHMIKDKINRWGKEGV